MIPNYNYREFVGDAIESRLEIDWPDKEVIVAQKKRRTRQAEKRFAVLLTSIFQRNKMR